MRCLRGSLDRPAGQHQKTASFLVNPLRRDLVWTLANQGHTGGMKMLKLPKKSAIHSRKLSLAMQYRELNASQLERATNGKVKKNKINDIVSNTNTSRGKKSDGKLSSDTKTALNQLAQALAVDSDWLLERETKFHHADMKEYFWREITSKPKTEQKSDDEMQDVRLWWADLDKAWVRLLTTQKDGTRQNQIIQMIGKKDAEENPWPDYQRTDLVIGNLYGMANVLNPLCKIFTVGQAYSLAPILLPKKKHPPLARVQEYQRQYDALRSIKESENKILKEFFKTKTDALPHPKFLAYTFDAVADSFEEMLRILKSGKKRIRNFDCLDFKSLLDEVFIYRFRNEPRYSLPDLLTLFRDWYYLKGFLPFDVRLERFLEAYGGRILETKALDSQLKIILESEAKIPEKMVGLKETMKNARQLLPLKNGFFLIANESEREYWDKVQPLVDKEKARHDKEAEEQLKKKMAKPKRKTKKKYGTFYGRTVVG